MAVQTETAGRPAAAGRNWYACTPEEIAAAAGVDPGAGLSAAQAADLLATNGPNSLPEEKPRPGWRRFLEEYREQHRAHMERMEGEGRRVMAAATRDLDQAAFDPDGDLLGYVTELQLTSLV